MSAPQGINVAIIGVGLVGTSVIQQLTTVAGLSSKLHIVALQNSKKTLFSTPSSPFRSPELTGSRCSPTAPPPPLALPDLVRSFKRSPATRADTRQ